MFQACPALTRVKERTTAGVKKEQRVSQQLYLNMTNSKKRFDTVVYQTQRGPTNYSES